MEINLTANYHNVITVIEALGGFSGVEATAIFEYLSGVYETINLDLVEHFTSYESILDAYENELGYEIEDNEIDDIEDMNEEEIEEAKDEIRKEKLENEGTLIEVSDGTYLYMSN